MFTDLHDITAEKRLATNDEQFFDRPEREPAGEHCLRCGWAVETSKHYGAVWTFDRNTDTLHVCRESHGVFMARLRGKLYREAHPNE